MRPRRTSTEHSLPFGELSSKQFETLVGELLKAEGHSDFRYWGISGGDGGCDPLGWTQATTTRRWPTSPRWRALAGGASPRHWLPRSQWHLAWLLHEPSSAVHREGLRLALSEGRSHGDHPGAAEALERIFCRAVEG